MNKMDLQHGGKVDAWPGSGLVYLEIVQQDGVKAETILTPVEARDLVIGLRQIAAAQDSNEDKTRPRRVVCAAIRCGATMVVGARHHDPLMNHLIGEIVHGGGYWVRGQEEQGFVDQHNIFMTREEAWDVAMAGGQVIRRCGGGTDDGFLYSENLY